MDLRARRSRETSPDRARVYMQQQKTKPLIKTVQVVYYLSRNGQLEHPHFMEVLISSNHQQLRLKNVMDRLTALRGTGMPSLYSWSSKRSYKNGYVWNDLAENDIIYPTEGSEYVLKGSELIEENFQPVRVICNKQQNPETNLQKKNLITLTTSQSRETEENENRAYEEDEDDNSKDSDEDAEKTSYSSSNTTQSRCSRGVSTDELEQTQNNPTELALDNHSVLIPSSENVENRYKKIAVTEEIPSRNSIFLQLIACGSSVGVLKNKKIQSTTSNSLHKGVLCKIAAENVTEDDMMINCMSMNPRFANLQSEEKEYFSGSIVDTMKTEDIDPGLKRSNSYNEERNKKTELEETIEKEETVEKETGMKGKCLPRKKTSSSSRYSGK